VRRELVLPPVAGQERHPHAADVADRDGRRRLAERCVHGHLVDGVDERIEPGSPEDPDRGSAQDDPFDVPAGCFEPPDPDDPDDPDDEDPPLPESDEDVVFDVDFSDEPDDPPSLFDGVDRLSVL
jgi:hypothetical protein